MTTFHDRQLWDLPAWPEMYDALKGLQTVVFLSPPGLELNMMVFTMSSLAAGSRHCQAHGAYTSHRLGVPVDKVQAMWSFEKSDMFDDRERAALSFALAAGSSPSSVEPWPRTVDEAPDTEWQHRYSSQAESSKADSSAPTRA